MQNIFFYHSLDPEFKYSDKHLELVYYDLKETIDYLALIVNGIWAEKIKDEVWKYRAEPLANKYITQSSTLSKVFLGTQLDFLKLGRKIQVLDVTSFYINLRSLIENYLMLFYLYFDEIPYEEQRMRWIIYQISGIRARRKLTNNSITNEKKKIILEKELNEEQELINELNGNKYYNLFSQKYKDVIENRNMAKVLDWPKIMERAGFKEDFFQNIWRLYSNYAHSEYLSVLQVYDFMSDSEETINIRNMSLFFNLILNCLMIKDFSNLYPELKNYFEEINDNDKRTINLLYGVGKYSS